jgi:hypothetical protein
MLFIFYKLHILSGLPGTDWFCLTRPIFTSPDMSIKKTADTGAMSNHTACSESCHTVQKSQFGVECQLLEILVLFSLKKAM